MVRKKTFLQWISTVALAGMVATPALAADVTVVVANVAEAKGQVLIAVFDSEKGWPGGEPKLAALVLPATAPEVRVTLHNLPATGVAVSAFQDINRDGTLGTSLFGIPNEPYGFSNGSKSFGPARVAVPESGATITVQLID